MPRPLKGSDEAKSKMSHLRSLRKNKSTKDAVESKSEEPTESPKEEVVEEIVGTGKKTNSWIRHVQQYAKANNMTYFKALKDPKLKEGYKK
jgi:hypothetical protein